MIRRYDRRSSWAPRRGLTRIVGVLDRQGASDLIAGNRFPTEHGYSIAFEAAHLIQRHPRDFGRPGPGDEIGLVRVLCEA